MRQILVLGPRHEGVFVEAGCFKGGSTAKFSLAAAAVGKKLVVFDSFRGIPDNDEVHPIRGHEQPWTFEAGDYRGSLSEVTSNVSRYGSVEHCEFVEGFFEDTMPHFKRDIIGLYIDVDLAASTRTCLKYLYPHIIPGGVVMSQDGHLSLVLEVFDDETFWKREIGTEKPLVNGFGKSKLLT